MSEWQALALHTSPALRVLLCLLTCWCPQVGTCSPVVLARNLSPMLQCLHDSMAKPGHSDLQFKAAGVKNTGTLGASLALSTCNIAIIAIDTVLLPTASASTLAYLGSFFTRNTQLQTPDTSRASTTFSSAVLASGSAAAAEAIAASVLNTISLASPIPQAVSPVPNINTTLADLGINADAPLGPPSTVDERSLAPTPAKAASPPTPSRPGPIPAPAPAKSPPKPAPAPAPVQTTSPATPASPTRSAPAPAPVPRTPSPAVTSPSPITASPSPVTASPSPVVRSPSPVVASPSPVALAPAAGPKSPASGSAPGLVSTTSSTRRLLGDAAAVEGASREDSLLQRTMTWITVQRRQLIDALSGTPGLVHVHPWRLVLTGVGQVCG